MRWIVGQRLSFTPSFSAAVRSRSECCRQTSSLAALVLMCLLMTGCGSKSETLEVHGKVTFDGQPVENGEIVFKPTETGGRPTMGAIVNGNYKIAEEFGAKPGKYTVVITANRPTGKKGSNPYAPDAVLTEQYIPRKYNVATTLKVEITDAGHPHDFALVGGGS